jgi:hypothetical protein
MHIIDLLRESNVLDHEIVEGDYFDIELDNLIIETSVIKVLSDGILIEADDTAMAYLGINEDQHSEKIEAYGYKYDRNDRRIVWRKIFPNEDALNKWADRNNATVLGTRSADKPSESVELALEAEYQGRNVPLGKPMKGDVKKSKVYVKGPSGRVVKVNFGDKKMKIKKSNPARRKSFRARHNCANPGPRHKARYWSCRAWE